MVCKMKKTITSSDEWLTSIQDKYGRLIRYVAGNILDNQDDVSECENDVYMALWREKQNIEEDGIKAYITKIARNKAIDIYKYNHAEKRYSNNIPIDELEGILPDKKGTEKFVEDKILSELIYVFLEKQDAYIRKIFVLKYWYFASIKDIAVITGKSKVKIESDLYRTRKKLKEFLKKED